MGSGQGRKKEESWQWAVGRGEGREGRVKKEGGAFKLINLFSVAF